MTVQALSFQFIRRVVLAVGVLALVSTFGAPASARDRGPVAATHEPTAARPVDYLPEFGWDVLEDTGIVTTFHSLDAVSEDVAWVASVDQAVARTVDGKTLHDVTPRRGSQMNFFDIEAVSADVALVFGVDFVTSLIFRTNDGGNSWERVFSESGYFNCMAMFDRRHGFAFGDPIDGEFQIIVTSDGGRSWSPIPAPDIPDALDGEGADQYPGNCAAATGRSAFFGTAYSAEGGRVFRSLDRGATWEVSETSLSGGVQSLDFRTNRLGLALGYTWARTTDGGATWHEFDVTTNPGDVAWWSDRRGDERTSVSGAQKTAFTVGWGGNNVTRDRGKTWMSLGDELGFTSVDCVESSAACWAVGGSGIAKLTVS